MGDEEVTAGLREGGEVMSRRYPDCGCEAL
jgi:hypothetical protein